MSSPSHDTHTHTHTHTHTRADFDVSEDVFQRLQKADPYRMEHMDTYSNILYVKEAKPELSHLAHHVTKVDQYRPEACCVVGECVGEGERERE